MSNTSSLTARSTEDIPIGLDLLKHVIQIEKRKYGGRQLSPRRMGLNAYLQAIKSKKVPSLFFHDGNVVAVAVAGDWTGWKTVTLERESQSQIWGVVLDVPLGTHVYKFVVDFGNNEETKREAVNQGWVATVADPQRANVLESPYMLIEISELPPPKGMTRMYSSGSLHSVVIGYSLKGTTWMVVVACIACAIGVFSQTIHAARTADYNTLSNRTVPTTTSVFRTPMPTRNSAIALVASLYLQLVSEFFFYSLMAQDYGIRNLLIVFFYAVSTAFYVTSTVLDIYTTKEFISKYHSVSSYIAGMLVSDALGILISACNALLVYFFVWMQRGKTRLKRLTKFELVCWFLAVLSYFLASCALSIRAPFISAENPLHFSGSSIPGAYNNHHQGLSYSPEPTPNSVVGLISNSLAIIISLIVESFLVFRLFSKEGTGNLMKNLFIGFWSITAVFYLAVGGLDLHSLLQPVHISSLTLKRTLVQSLVALDFAGAALSIGQAILYWIWKAIHSSKN
eukprot:jgi/Galph1/380/GphlegSOOS_G5022.1